MSTILTAASPGAVGPVLVKREIQEIPRSLAGSLVPEKADLTIHRISETHHGRTLLMLGHAAEHLANARRFAIGARDERSEAEAIHILLGLSRVVFDELAGRNTRRRRMEQWLMERVTGLIERRGERMGRPMSDNGRRGECAPC